MGIILNEEGFDYALIHILDINKYQNGVGHTVLYTSFDDTLTLIDSYGGAIIKRAGKNANFQDLLFKFKSKINNIEFTIINKNKPASSVECFQSSYTDHAFIGVTNQKDLDNYYSFVNLIGAENHSISKFNQELIRGLGSMFNKLPNIYVSSDILKAHNFNFNKFYALKLLSYIFVLINWSILTIIVSILFLFIKSINLSFSFNKK